MGLLIPAAPAAAVDPIPGTPIPSEPESIALPLPVTDAMAFDVDDDGIRDLLVVTGSEAGQGLAAVQAWYVDDLELGASAASHGIAVPLRRSASVDELLSGRGRLGIDRDDMIAVRINEPAKFLVVKRDGREIPLVAAIGTDTEFNVDCCLTIWEVVVDSQRSMGLRLVAATQRFAGQMIAADMDADGTDELIVTEGPGTESDEALRLSLLRWTGARYARTGFTIPDTSNCCLTILDAGETDGVPGAEVLLSAAILSTQETPFGLQEFSASTGLHRVSLREGTPFVERAEIVDVVAARAVSVEAGPRVLATDHFAHLVLWSWPRDGQPQQLRVRTTGGSPAAVFGVGADVRIFMASGFAPSSVLVFSADFDIGSGPGATIGRDTRAGAFRPFLGPQGEGPPPPFFGVFPGGVPGAPDVFMFAGKLVRPVADPEVMAEAQSMALLAGVEAIGSLGPRNAWAAVLSNFFGPDLGPPGIDLSFARTPGTLSLVSLESVLEPEAEGAHLTPTFYGAAPDPDQPTGLMVGGEAVDAEITGPPGTRVWWRTRGDSGDLTIGAEGVARIRLLDPAGPLAPDRSGDSATVWLVTPAGHGYSGTWPIQVYRQPPSLALTADDALLNFRPMVAGQTVPGATVTVNGSEVAVTDDGSFAAPVEVGLWPTELRVVAVDPVGNRTERVVSVVWPLDYRRLPFVPIAVLLTVVAAVVLFLRRPDAGPTRRTPDDGATFEEIGG